MWRTRVFSLWSQRVSWRVNRRLFLLHEITVGMIEISFVCFTWDVQECVECDDITWPAVTRSHRFWVPVWVTSRWNNSDQHVSSDTSPFLNLLNVQEITGARVAREHTLFTDTVWVVCDAEFRHMSVMQGNFWRRKCMCFLHRSAFHIRHTPSLMQQICIIKIVNIRIIQPRSTLKILNPHVYGHINIKCCTFSIL